MIPRFQDWAYQKYKTIETTQHHLRYLFFEVTRRCNLACLHCGSDCSTQTTMKEMELSTWIDIMDYVKAWCDPFIVITGGEPLVRNDLLHITKALHDRSLKWGMVSNGLAMNDGLFSTLISHGISSMTISLDGPREQHSFIRRNPHAYEKAIQALNLLGKSSLEFRDAVSCVYPGNLQSLHETAKILLDCGINSWRLFRIFPKGKAAKNPGLILDFSQSQELITWIAENRNSYKKKGLSISFSCEGYLPFGKDRLVRDEPFFCRAGINIASILSDGTVTGCNNNGDQYYQGNLLVDDLQTLWQERFMEFRDRTWMKTGLCRECRDWNSCLGSSIHLKDKNREGPGFCYLNR